MPTCVAVGCKNRLLKGSRNTFHMFPFSRPEICEQWIANVCRADWTPSRRSLLCSDHFDSTSFDLSGVHTRLHPTAVPTIFNYNAARKSTSTVKKKAPSANPRRKILKKLPVGYVYTSHDDSEASNDILPELQDDCLFTEAELQLLDEAANHLVVTKKNLRRSAAESTEFHMTLVIRKEVVPIVRKNMDKLEDKISSTIVINVVNEKDKSEKGDGEETFENEDTCVSGGERFIKEVVPEKLDGENAVSNELDASSNSAKTVMTSTMKNPVTKMRKRRGNVWTKKVTYPAREDSAKRRRQMSRDLVENEGDCIVGNSSPTVILDADSHMNDQGEETVARSPGETSIETRGTAEQTTTMRDKCQNTSPVSEDALNVATINEQLVESKVSQPENLPAESVSEVG